jgi:methylthioribose-1-phosphate isomerase
MRGANDAAVPAAGRSAGVLQDVLRSEGSSRRVTGVDAVRWDGDAVAFLDQRGLPHDVRYGRAATADDIVVAIASLAVRGAPCIGVFAAYGIALLRKTIEDEPTFQRAAARVRTARPTAVNLAWAVDRTLAAPDMLAEAHAIAAEQREIDDAIGRHGLELVGKRARILTHCNTGPLATAGGAGTALAIVLAAQRAGKRPCVYVDETRPLLQGARLTYWELQRAGVEAVLQTDAAAASAMARRSIDLAIVGADRIARNGDTANKVGTYGLAVLAAHHGIPFYVAAPRSTFDFALASGDAIPIEERDASEVTHVAGAPIAPDGTIVYNPAFDVTPAHLITGFVTEFGILRPPYRDAIADLEWRDEVLRVR